MQRRAANILCFKCRVIRDFTILFVYPSILRKLRLTCRTQDAGARGWLGRRRGQDAGRTRALCGPYAGRGDARREPDAGQMRADAVPSYFLAVLYVYSINTLVYYVIYPVNPKLYQFVNIVLCKTQRLEAMASGEAGREGIATTLANKTL